MAIDFRIGTKILKNLRTDSVPATSINPYPYIGIVKNNLDPTRCGRIQVFIPELGGNPDDQSNWRTLSYASPFMGYTSTELSTKENPDTLNSFGHTTHTYGMWMVPPDIGIEVICIFIAGDPMRGYWVACVNSNLSRYMLPALGSSTNTDTTNANSQVVSSYVSGDPAPVTEFNENNGANKLDPTFYKNKKPIHEIQYNILNAQGLETDRVRGVIGSSSQRETPSQVFGISTPGRPVNDPADDPEYVEKASRGDLSEEYYRVKTRKGGHTFVMDDGSVLGQDQLIRLRTAKGHQVLLHDTEKTLYISHADGSSWIELTKEGAVNIYSENGVNVRSQGTINLHSDKDVNINAEENIQIKAGKAFNIETDQAQWLTRNLHINTLATMDIRAECGFSVDAGLKLSLLTNGELVLSGEKIMQNSENATNVDSINKLAVNFLPDTKYNSTTKKYVSDDRALASIVTVAPSHEPYNRTFAAKVKEDAAVNKNKDLPMRTRWNYATDSTKRILTAPVTVTVSNKDMRKQPIAGSIGKLTAEEVTAYFAHIAGSNNYDTISVTGKLGRYAFTFDILKTVGLVKSSVTSNSQLANSNSWIGNRSKSDPTTRREFLINGSCQEEFMYTYTQLNYNALIQSGVITDELTSEQIVGILAIAHVIGLGAALNWRIGSNPIEAPTVEDRKNKNNNNDRSASRSTPISADNQQADNIYQNARYAVRVMAPKVAEINAG